MKRLSGIVLILMSFLWAMACSCRADYDDVYLAWEGEVINVGEASAAVKILDDCKIGKKVFFREGDIIEVDIDGLYMGEKIEVGYIVIFCFDYDLTDADIIAVPTLLRAQYENIKGIGK